MSAVATKIDRVYLLRRDRLGRAIRRGVVLFSCDDDSNREIMRILGHGLVPYLDVRASKWRELGEPESITLTLTVGEQQTG